MYNPMVGGGTFVMPQNMGIGGPAPSQSTAFNRNVSVIDGTPVRVVALAFAAAGGLFALKLAGIRFNVGVSTR